MINNKLQTICRKINEWCSQTGTVYDIVCDEHDLQGVLIFKRNNPDIDNLFDNILPIAVVENIHLDHRKVRNGDIILMSLKAVNEATIQSIMKTINGNNNMSLAAKIENAFAKTYTHTPVPPAIVSSPSFDDTAKKIVEMQYKAPSSSRKRSSRDRNKIHNESKFSMFDYMLGEALEGMATPTDAQPNDLFSKFARALQVLGEKMGVGPLQNKLKEQGINWKKSDDGQSVILFVINGQTKAPQAIASINSATLEQPHDFEEQLAQIIDLAKGDAPGAFKQQQEMMRQQEKAMSDIAKSVAPPPEPTGINAPSAAAPAAAPAATPAPAPASAAPARAAQATPKPGTKMAGPPRV